MKYYFMKKYFGTDDVFKKNIQFENPGCQAALVFKTKSTGKTKIWYKFD